MNDDEIPVRVICDSLRRLDSLILNGQWEECVTLSNDILNYIKLAINPRTCKTGTPHLDGVRPYHTGRMYYSYAPSNVKKSLEKMNRIIKAAKNTIPNSKGASR